VSGASDCKLVVTDLDGTLLDEETYDVAPARPGLEALRERRLSLVLCSSKTRAEMESLAEELGFPRLLIVENGGALVVPAGWLPALPPGARRDGKQVVVALGTPRTVLVEALPEVAGEAGVAVRGFATMTAEDVAGLTGLGRVAAERALQRQWDEPFVVEGDPGPEVDAELQAAARRRGLRVTCGGRFRHLTGSADKGQAVRSLMRLLPHDPHGRTVGLGDAANDLPMLQAVDRPIVMPGKDGTIDAALISALPRAERAPEPGPAGWARAVLAVLAGAPLPRVTS
jgi:mannosyl-3-phosphoglycerate phosphatase